MCHTSFLILSKLLTLSGCLRQQVGRGRPSPLPAVIDPIIITRGEEGVSYVQRLIALGDPTGRGKVSHGHLQACSKETNIYMYPFNTHTGTVLAANHSSPLWNLKAQAGQSQYLRPSLLTCPFPACAPTSVVPLRSLGLGPTHHQHSSS